jgi:hypothetical protein
VLAKSIQDGVERNSAAELPALQARLDTLKGWMPKVQEGDVISLTYEPGRGTTLQHGPKVLGTLPGKDFADALFACWLGAHAVQDDLKAALLDG